MSGLTNITQTQACACAAGVCTVGVTGTLNYNGAASFNFTVTANSQTSAASSATLTISPVADVPVAANITPAAFVEDTQEIITLSYSDVDNDLASTCALSNLGSVTVTQGCACTLGTCTVGITGTSHYNGSASFDYTVTANGDPSNTASASLSILPFDDAPVASNITPAAFNEDLQGIITLSYSDVEADLASTCSVAAPSNITITQACACAAGVCTVGVTGTPLNYNGVASFTYTVTANTKVSNSSTASLTITPVNDAPVSIAIAPANFNEDSQSIITLSYSDVDGDLATSCAPSALANVTVTQACACAAGSCTIGVTPTLNYNGSASFNFTVTAAGLTSTAATASLTVDPVNDIPVAANITPSAFNEDTQSVITLAYSDVDGDTASSCLVSNLTNVTQTQGCSCAAGICTVGVTGTPLNFNGAASFDFTVTANGQTSVAASAALTISAVDDNPVAINLTPAAFNEDVQSIINLSYTDVEGDQATTCTVSNLSNATVTQACSCLLGSCSVGVTGNPLNYNGIASFDYTVTATGLTSNTATSSLTISAVDDVPVANNITPAAFDEDLQSVVTLSYSDVESDLASSCAVTSVSNVTVTQGCACAAGTCTVGVTGSPLNYNGPANFTYTVTSNGLTSVAATASLTVSPVNDAPVAANIAPASFNEDLQGLITLSYTDLEGDLATACTLSGLTNVTQTQSCACAAGTCTVGVTGTPLNYNGAASFNYTVTATGQTSAAAAATLTIDAVNDAPVVASITPAAFNEDTQGIITLSYSDVDGDSATVCAVSGLTNVTETQVCACAAGVCTVGVTGSPLNYNGAASFNYTVTAAGQLSNSTSATLSITPVNDTPIAANITPVAFNEDVQSIITLSYNDVDGDSATSCSLAALTNVSQTQACACAAGICTVGVTGSPLNFNGAASFTYTVTATGQTSAAATATLSISPVNDVPVVANISPASFNEDLQGLITLAYSDVDGDTATACAVTGLTNVTQTQGCACAAGICTVGVTGTPLNYNGSGSFNFTVTAAGQTSASALATLTIDPVNDVPVAANITPAAFNEDVQNIITLSYSDVDGDTAVSCVVSGLSNVTETQVCACAAGVCTVGVTGTPLNYNGVANFNYTVTANSQTSAAATANLTINNVDDAPVAANITPAAFNEDAQSIITLSYSDVEGDLAVSCTPSNLSNVTVTQGCVCAAGTCTVGVTGSPVNYFGAASFDYTVTANGQASTAASAALTIINVNDAPVTANISPASFNEDVQSIITLSYTDPELDLASTCTIASVSSVTVTQACACAAGVCTVGVTGTPLNYNGTANFTYTVTANTQTSNTSTATLTVDPVNDVPVAANITPAAFNEDVQSIITLSYSDVDGDLATACTPSALTNVTVTQACACAAGTCTVGVTGSPLNYNGAASFNYTVTANGQTSAAVAATLSITAVNDTPVAINLTPAAFNEDVQSVITLTYTDAEGDLAAACSLSTLSNVTVTQACACAVGTCTVGVTGSPLNYNGIASFSYNVTAGGQTSANATASLTVSAVDDAPVAVALTPAAFNEDTQQIITLNYSDVDGDLATACTPSALTNVTVTQTCACAAGTCTVGVTGSPLNYNGAASFNYTVTANGQTSAAVAATLSITNVNDAPVAAAISPAAFNEDTQAIITLSYSDADSDLATACTPSALTNVTVTQACACAAGTCTVGVTGSPLNYNGAASFNYTVTANGQTSAAVAATLSITAVNDAPVAVALTPAAFNENTQEIINLSYSDVDGDLATACTPSALTNVTVTQACACAAGTCTVGVTGSPLNYYGAASFNYTVTANGQTSAVVAATLSINNVDNAPVAAAISPAAFNEDTQAIITLSYSDADSDLATACTPSALANVTVTQACACAAGTCTVGVTGSPLNYNGAASLNYTVTANGQSSAAVAATLSITNVNDAPVAAAISPAAFNEDTQQIITLSYSDVDGDLAIACTPSALTNVTVTQACACAAGTCTVGVTGSPLNFNGAASFNYTVTANSQTSAAVAATLSITNVNDAPVAVALTPAAFNEDIQQIITLSYSDVDGDLASACAPSALTNVTVTQACACAAGTCTVGVTGSPLNYNGAASFNYTVTANSQTSAAVAATLSITNVNDAPVAAVISPAAFNEDTQQIITLSYSDVEGDLATACTPSALTNVTVTQACACAAGTCTVGVTGSPLNYNGAASFNYTVTANGQTSTAATATLSITNVNDAPVAVALTPAAFNEDTQEIINLSYSDVDGDIATACTPSNLTNVTVTQACACAVGACSIGVTGSPLNYNGTASFDYTITANAQTSTAVAATLSITNVNDAPVAAAISPAAFNEDTQQIITLSYSDVEGDLASACTPSALANVSVTQACACAAGTCTVGVTGSPLNYNGAASFNYTVTANSQTSAAVAATLSITNVNDAPVAAAISPAAFNEDTQQIITLSYSDVDSDLATSCTPSNLSNITVTQACACAAGTCTMGVTGSPLNFNGAASFDYTVTANGQTSAVVAATLAITNVNDAPVAAAISPAAFNEDTQQIITLSYSDVDGDLAIACTPSALTNVTVTQACACAAGTCTVGVTGSPLNYNGAASFNYTVTANAQTSAAVAATLAITNVNDAPVAAAISPAAFNEDTQQIITLSYSDVEADLATACTPSALTNVTVTQTCACAAGTCTVGVTGSPLNYNGAASFNYTVTANSQTSAAAAATLSITNVNDAPVAAAISPAAFNEDTQQIITLSYSDVDGDLATACAPSALTNVTVTQACACAAGTCTVGVTGSPLNYNGAASFDYTVTANGQTSAAVAATLAITNVNDAPVAVALTPAAFNEDTQQIITLSYSDVDGDLATACTPSALTNVTVTQACACAAGTCTVGVTGSPLNYNGAASFNYTVTANAQTSAAVAATLSITNVNDAPVAAAISPAAFNEDTQQIITLSYSDVDGDLASACTPSALTNVTVTQACACATGTCTVGVTGSPLNYNGAASFNYTVTANSQTSAAVAATLSITNVNDAPVAAAISPAAFNEDTQQIITLSYSDVDSDLATSCTPSNLSNITVTQACACAAGTCTVGVTGSPLNFNGAASFDYTVTANGQTSAVVAATLAITNVNDAPVAVALTPAAFNEDTQQIITLSYSDVEGDLATACTPSVLTNVTVTQACACAAGTCTVGVTGSPLNYNGAASFNYTVTANSQTSAAVAATLSITNVNDAPVAAAISPAAFNEDTQQIITLSYSDVDGDLAIACTPSALTNVTVTQACACAAGTCTVGVTGSPLNYNGAASFDYTVTANGQTSAAVAATLSITNVNDAPVAAAISPAAFNEDTQQIITLSYSDVDGDLAIACTPSALTNVTVTQACACAAGTCTVGVTGSPLNYNGAASFNYTVTANAQTSAAVAATLSITNVNDAPVAAAISPAAFNEDTQQIITLSYSDVDGDLAIACTPSALANVTVTQACACATGTCTVGVTGSPLNYSGAASFNYTVTANGQTSAAVAATLSITNVNDAPVAAAISPAAFNEDTQQIITLSYSDVDGDLATACTPSALINVTVTQACACAAGACTVGVTGSPLNYNGAASFNYTVTANGQTSAAVAATLSITNVNDAPVAAAISPAAFNEDTQEIITLSYSDVDGDLAIACTPSALTNVTVTQACACAAGACTVGVTGSPLNYNGAASFDYTVTANGQTSAAVAATLSITNVNDAPVAAAISPAAFNEDTQQIITLSYSDVDGDLAIACTPSALTNVTVTQACACAAGACTVGITGSPLNYNGAASFNYTVTANGQTSAAVAATLSITNVNDAPVAAAISPAAFNEDTQEIITLSYSDVDGDLAIACTPSALTNVTVTQACACAAGTCTVGVTGSPLNYNGAASFNYTVTANAQTSAAAAATLSITAVNDIPVAINLTPAAFNEDVQSVITLTYTDIEGDVATACSLSALTNVTVTQACACTLGTCTVGVTGSPLNYNGIASFDYNVTAGGQTSANATASLTVSAVDDAPVAAAISPAAFNEDTQSIINLSYSDVELHSATTCSIPTVNNVTVTQACACTAGACTVGVTGLGDYNGAASFTYTVTANGLTSAAATATLSITNVNDVPVAANISPPAFNEDVQSIITLSYTDADSDLAGACAITGQTNVTVTQACACAAGTCTVGVTGSPVSYNGAADFTYTVTANTQTSIAKMATLFITGVDDAPVVAAFTPATFAEDTQSLDITLAYTDAESHLATSCSITSLNNVTVTQACACAAGNCTVRVTGTANYNGAASFAYSVVANGLSSAAAAATFTISAVDDVPSTASFTAASFNEDIQSVITLSYVDVDNDLASACTVSTLSGVSVTQACACTAGGVCTVGVTGSPVNFFGAVSFDYTITAAGQTSTPVRTVSSTILSVNDAPTMALIPASSTVKNTQSAAITVSTGDVDHPAMTCTNTYLSMSSDNTAKVLNSSVVWAGTWPNCTAQVTPVTNATGTINLTFTVIDPLGATASRTFAFSINGAHMVIVLGGVIVTSYDFGNPTGNISQAFTVRNDGNQASSVLGAVVNGGPNFQMGFDNCGAVAVAAGGSCTATVDWRENVGGATPANKTGDLTITYTLGTAVLTTTAIK
ncbi:MAG TPA: tandem-95 repeat protein [Bacteriovoracaceae bacterium]|nr:tandem-95 repeat protein [Bacteriovoracaceae bacterium]